MSIIAKAMKWWWIEPPPTTCRDKIDLKSREWVKHIEDSKVGEEEEEEGLGGQVICYNYGEVGHIAWDLQNLMRLSGQYCRQFNHVIEYYLVLIEKMLEKKTQPE